MATVPLVVLLVGAEVAAHVLGLDQGNAAWDRFDDTTPCHQASLELGWEAIPSECGRDEHGFIVAHEPRTGTAEATLVVLGDSIADQDLWVDVVRRGLPELDVLNAGVRGYGPCQELALARRAIEAVEPDWMLLQTCANDLHEAPVLTVDDTGNRTFRWAGDTFTVPGWLFYSELAGWLALRYAEANLARNAPEDAGAVEAANLRCLTQLRDLAAAADIGLSVVAFPVLAAPAEAGTLYDSEETLRLHVESLNIPQLALRAEFGLEASSWTAMRSTPQDLLHPNERAMRRAGRALLPFLGENLTR